MTTGSGLQVHPYRADMATALLELWQQATGGRFPITLAQWQAGTRADPYFRPDDGLVLVDEGRPVAFLLLKRYRGDDPGCAGFLNTAWISLMAVAKDRQRAGLGRMLLEAAIERCIAAGATTLWLGGDFQHFAPGLPDQLAENVRFFLQQGFVIAAECWDVQRDLEGFQVPARCAADLAAAAVTGAPFRTGQERALLELLQEGTFPPRWHHDAARFLAGGGDLERYVGLWRDGRPLGFAWIHPPGSEGNLRWQGWQPQITALGPIGVASSQRGHGLGLALLAVALERLRDLGARRTVIDWTDLLEFYGRLGFQPWIRYTRLRKELQRTP